MKNQTNMFKSYKCGFQTKGFFKTKRKLFKLEKENHFLDKSFWVDTRRDNMRITNVFLKQSDITLKSRNFRCCKRHAYKKYFMHGTSHHLGLDTHDYGLERWSFLLFVSQTLFQVGVLVLAIL